MEYKKYNKELNYSYSYGGFPTYELLKKYPKYTECLILHEKLEKSEDINKIMETQINTYAEGK